MSKKLIIAISALALAILAGAIAVVGVFAAQQQKVANTFTISYTANNVSAIVSIQYYDEYFNLLDGESYFEIEAGEAEKKYETTSLNHQMTANNKIVVFPCGFTNTNSIGGKDMSVALYNNATMKNINIWYDLTGTDDFNAIKVDENKTIPDAQILAPGEGITIVILIEIADLTLDAEFISTADAGLGFTLNAVS